MDLKLSYFDNEIEHELCLIFVHGNSLTKSVFQNQLNDEKLNEFRLISIDLPGHGGSVHDDELYNPPKLIEIIKDFVKSKNLKKVVLVGHSLGGNLALEAIPEFEELVGVFVFGTPPLSFPPDIGAAFLPHAATPFLFAGELEDDQVETVLSAFTLERSEELKVMILQTDPNFRLGVLASIGAGQTTDEVAIIASSNVPIAIALGDADALVNRGYILNLDASKFWGNTLHLIKNSGHSPQWEQAEEFNALLYAFVAEVNN